MGLREKLRAKSKELDTIYGNLSKAMYEEENSSNPPSTFHETEQYISVLAWLSESIDSLDKAIDNIPYPY